MIDAPFFFHGINMDVIAVLIVQNKHVFVTI